MAISPPSDIVLDVVRAADPASKKAAVEKLTALRQASAEPTKSADMFETIVKRNQSQQAGLITSPLLTDTAPKQTHDQLNPYEKFEAFVLQTFVQEMLPDDAESVFGGGTAGDIWKSLLAEQLAGQVTRGGGIGIAKQLEAAAAAKQASATVGTSPQSPQTDREIDQVSVSKKG